MAYRELPPLPSNPFECLQQGCERPWEVAIEPFQVAPRTWYVGNNWVGAYLLATSDGLILIDSTMQPQVYLLLESIRKLGFDPLDVKFILLSHMHYDHSGGMRVLLEHTGADVLMSRQDWDFMNARPDMVFESGYPFGPFEPGGFFSDDQPLVLGDRSVRTLLTPGHTPGTTSFFFDAADGQGNISRCGLHGGVGLNTLSDEFLKEFNLPFSARDDYLTAMLSVRDLPVDITLGSHPAQVGMIEKSTNIAQGQNPFFDPSIWPAFIDDRIAQVRKLMEKVA